MIAPLRLALPKLWDTRGPMVWPLVPFSWAYIAATVIRRTCYTQGLCRVVPSARPVVVVGGITAGGSGKTPLVMHVVRLLRERGYSPGVVSRGYGGRPPHLPLFVERQTPVDECGDEPAMMARHLDVPIAVDRDRPRAVEALIERGRCDVVISDDGLQHYAMDRRVEIVVIDGYRGLGNGYCLPAGPLREPRSRLASVDIVVCHGAPVEPCNGVMKTRITGMRCLRGNEQVAGDAFRGQQVHAVAGTGNPSRFFDDLRELGLEVTTHPFPDHHRYRFEDFTAMQDAPIVMTEKDAVKCSGLPLDNAWHSIVTTTVDPEFDEKLIQLLKP